MGFPLSKITRQYYLKIIMHVLHKSNEATLKEIGLNIFHQNSFIHMSSIRLVKLMSNKYAQVII